jgi:hypothetical protein
MERIKISYGNNFEHYFIFEFDEDKLEKIELLKAWPKGEYGKGFPDWVYKVKNATKSFK